MFENSKAFSGFAVDDLAAARDFYGRVLGVDVAEHDGLLELRFAGGTSVLAYPKPDHVPANFTILNFPVADIEKAVEELAGRGVVLERYDAYPGDDKGIHRGDGGPPIAWFKDPSGNIIAVLQE